MPTPVGDVQCLGPAQISGPTAIKVARYASVLVVIHIEVKHDYGGHEMTRLAKILGIAGLASVYLMQTPCTFAQHGFSIIPNGLIPNPFLALTQGALAPLIGNITGT